MQGEVIVFIEVKTARISSGAPELPAHPHLAPLESLRGRQRARIRRAAAAWLRGEVTGGPGPDAPGPEAARPTATAIRFDAIGVTLDARGELKRLDHIEGAW
jgi:Uncharacterised protein family UPF0102